MEKYYDEYVEPFFDSDSDFDENDYNSDPEIDNLEGDNDGNWEDVSDDDSDNDMSSGSMDSIFRANTNLAVHMMMAEAFGPPPDLGYHDGDGILDDMWDPDDLDAESESDLYDENDVAEAAELLSHAPPWLWGVIPGFTLAATAPPDTDSATTICRI